MGGRFRTEPGAGRGRRPTPVLTSSSRGLFISHVAEEGVLASILKRHLQAALGREVQIFCSSEAESIAAGELWVQSLHAVVARTDLMLALCSDRSARGEWIHFEVGAAWARGVPVIPLVHSGFLEFQLHPPLSLFQVLRISDTESWQRLLAAVADRLGMRASMQTADAVAEIRRYEEDTSPLLERPPSQTAMIEDLHGRLRSARPDVRDEAIQCLTACEDPIVIPALMEQLREGRNLNEAISSLRMFGVAAAPAIPLLEKYVDDEELGLFVVHALGEMGPTAVPILSNVALHDDDLRTMAIDALQEIGGEPAAKALFALLPALEDTQRESVVEALSELGAIAGSFLEQALNDPYPAVREAAALALAQLGKQGHPVAGTLSLASRDPDEKVRSEAILALAEPGGVEHLEALLELSRSSFGSYKLRAIELLGRLGKPAIEALEQALQSDDEWILAPAAEALGKLGGAAASCVPALARLSDHPRYSVRRSAIDALGRIGDRNAAAALARLAKNPPQDSAEDIDEALRRVALLRGLPRAPSTTARQETPQEIEPPAS